MRTTIAALFAVLSTNWAFAQPVPGYLEVVRQPSQSVLIDLSSFDRFSSNSRPGDVFVHATVVLVFPPGGATAYDVFSNTYDCTDRTWLRGPGIGYSEAGFATTVFGAPETHYRFEASPDVVRLYEPPIIADRSVSPRIGTVEEDVLHAVCGKWRSIPLPRYPDLKTAVALARKALAPVP